MYDISVIGDGIVGLTAALALAKSKPNAQIVLLAAPKSQKSSHVLAINASNIRHLLNLGVDLQHDRHSRIEQMEVFGNSRSKIEFDYLTNSNYYSKVIAVQSVIDALYQEVQKTPNIHLNTGTVTVIAQHNHSISFNLAQSDQNIKIDTKIMIAADGANSNIRKAANIKMESIPYSHIAVTGTFSCEQEHHNTAVQYFLKNSGIIAYLPYGYKQVSIVYSCPDSDIVMRQILRTPQTIPGDIINQHIAELSHYHLGNMRLIGPLSYHSLSMNLVDKFYQQNIIIIGDAAHTLHPLAGQGVNLGLQDVWQLVAAVQQLELDSLSLNSKKYSRLMNKYNYSRMFEVRKIQLVCHTLFRLFNMNSPIIDKVRNQGLNFINRSQLLKKALLIR